MMVLAIWLAPIMATTSLAVIDRREDSQTSDTLARPPANAQQADRMACAAAPCQDAANGAWPPSSTSVLPGNVLALRNRTGTTIYFRLQIGTSSTEWHLYRLAPGIEVEPRFTSLWASVTTGTSSFAAPNLGGLASERATRGGTFFRRLKGGKRHDLCWVAGERRFVIEERREKLC